MKIWILFLCAVAAGVSAQSNEAGFDWNEDYDDAWFRTQLEKLEQLVDDSANGSQVDKEQEIMDTIVDEDIKKFEENENAEANIDDYQFEDNRSEQSEQVDNDENSELVANIDDGNNVGLIPSENDYDDYALKIGDYYEHNPEDEVIEPEPKFSNDDDIAPLEFPQSSDDIKQIMKETQAILNEEEQKPNDFASPESIEENGDSSKMMGEAKDILDEEILKSDDFDNNDSKQVDDNISKIIQETKEILDEEILKPNDFDNENDEQVDDNISKIIQETKEILDEEIIKPNDFDNENDEQRNENISNILDETKDILEEENIKPNDFASESNEDYENPMLLRDLKEKDGGFDQIEYPEKTPNDFDDDFEKEIDDNLSENIVDKDEDTVDKVYEDLNQDLDELFETLDKLISSDDSDGDEKSKADTDYAVNSDETLADKPDYENVFDSNLSDIFAEHSKVLNDENLSEISDEANNEKTGDQITDTSSKQQSVEQVLELFPFIDDAIPNDEELVKSVDESEEPIKSVNVDGLSDDQLLQMMKDFEIQHSDVFDVELASDNHIVNEITLEYGEIEVIKSENYPSGYPTNRIVDWIVTGNGQGIELNVTDFAVNSALGDYLMVKPGQVDDSGSDGLIFAYHLNEPRAYRFTDVDKMFIRFDSKLGMSFLRGFNLTLKMIAPLPEEPEPVPEPEPILPEPRHSLTVLLGGLTLADFQDIREDFRLLIADMATMYINANGIQPGINTTAEITQIISASICNVHWPGYDECVQVRFSVPLVYEDESEEDHRLHEADLQNMWETYVDTDPFATRLRQMGIEEFSAPNDGNVLTVWLVVALGVLVSAAMLAIALWRYSCFEDYTRMPSYSDTDSLHEKRSSLYPTPHQMLPPLYAENDYISTKVDMGGYENRSYTHTNMYDLDSDEDVIATRDRDASVQPRDVFSV